MMLTLNWVDEHSESASSENIRSALREVPVNLVRVDTLPEGRGALGAQGRGTVCWLLGLSVGPFLLFVVLKFRVNSVNLPSDPE